MKWSAMHVVLNNTVEEQKHWNEMKSRMEGKSIIGVRIIKRKDEQELKENPDSIMYMQ